ENLPTIQTNASIIYIILKNIIENGLKFNEFPTPTVWLSTQSSATAVEISIKDNGIGIAPDYQEQIFDMFKRLNHRNDFEGSGIGLAIVKLLMEKLGGCVNLESEPKKGSTFILKLPV
ncbi:MAG: ATP-binding protein, partial [Bacteroidota bacterium]